MDIKNYKEIIVAKDCARTANVQVWDPNAATTYLGNGEVVITDAAGNILTSTTAVKAVDKIFIKYRDHIGDGTLSTMEIRGEDITGFYCENYAVASEQKIEIGYNGSAGNADIEALANTTYWFKLIPLFKRGDYSPETFSWYSGSSVPEVADILQGLASNLNVKRIEDKLLKVKAYVETDSSAVSGVGTTAAVITNSKYVTFAAVHGLTGGELLTINSKVYKVDTVLSTTKIVLDQPYLDASDPVAVVSSVTDKSTGNWGMTIEGLPYEFKAGFYNYNKAKFDYNFPPEWFNTKPVFTAAERGIGTYEQVRELEWNGVSRKGKNKLFHSQYPVDRYINTDSVATDETYDLVTITFLNDSTKNIDGNVNHFGSITLAIPVGAGQGDGGTNTLEEVLNKYIVTEYAVPGATAIALT